jgi:hypothetical protein
MIDAGSIETAERLLKFVGGGKPDGHDRSFKHYEVERQDYENFHQEMMSLVIKRCQQEGIQIPPRLVPVINTLMAHHFLVGVVCGKEAKKVIA